ncbi:flagellar biosynthesis protein FlhB [Nitrospira sp.]|nr:flagellar biosynthesis protein FlhB [Nitrospira sp.]
MSRDLTMAGTLMVALILLYSMSDLAITRVVMIMREWLGMAGRAAGGVIWSPEALQRVFFKLGTDSLMLVLPLMVCVAVTATGLSLLQTGFNWRSEGLTLDLTRLSPLSGFKRLVTWRSVVELVKAFLKVSLIAVTAFVAARADVRHLTEWVQLDVAGILGTTGSLMLTVTLWSGLLLVGLAVLDYGYQRFEWQRGLRMSKQELKEETREAEGDPQIRSRIRTLQRDAARKRMMAAVPKATVVVTNPTHIAVALRYEEMMAAPVVVAKGAGFIAERIKEIAREHGVMVIERPPVARSLYKLVDIGKEIPLDLYRAVAEILALVYRAKNRTVGRG